MLHMLINSVLCAITIVTQLFDDYS